MLSSGIVTVGFSLRACLIASISLTFWNLLSFGSGSPAIRIANSSPFLGGMHGDSGKPSYMSIPMPNTFSMSPNYVKKYINTHRLTPPTHDAFEVIRYRLERLYIDRLVDE